MKTLKDIALYIVVATLITWGSTALKSNFLFDYLSNNIIGLLLTLLAINTATLGLIASKIQDFITQNPEYNFQTTIKEMKKSLIEQIVLLALSIVGLVVLKSSLIVFDCKEFICNVSLVTILIYSICILWDTGNAVFVVIEEIQKKDKNKK